MSDSMIETPESMIETPENMIKINESSLDKQESLIEHGVIQPSLKIYRSAIYNEYDTKYATELLKYFKRLNEKIKIDFNNFTENLMDEKQITRHSLLNAIDEFKKSEIYINNYKQNIYVQNWIYFIDNAFNCRPYQPCCVM